MNPSSLIGVGLYSVREVSRLTGVPASHIRRWAFGLKRKYKNREVFDQPVWKTEISAEGSRGLGFHDLLEIRFIHAFKSHGVSLQAIRQASRNASELFDSDHPFTCQQFRTDGKSIFADLIADDQFEDDDALIDLVRKQYVFEKVVSPSLYAGIEYSDSGAAALWWPDKTDHVVLDPKRAFGKPIDPDTGVPTEVLYQAFLIEEDRSVVASLYGVSKAALDAAIRFESRIERGAVLH